MIELLIGLIVLLLVIYVVHLIVEALAFPENIKRIIYLVLAIIFLLVLFSKLGLYHLRI
jgi:energy-converting hydrogenase Eha subunit F